DFGDFASVNALAEERGDFVGGFGVLTPRMPAFFDGGQSKTCCSLYIRAHTLLNPLIPTLSASPHAVLSSHFLLRRLLSEIKHTPFVCSRVYSLPMSSPCANGKRSALRSALRATVDCFEDSLLTAFDVADGKGDEQGMHEAAEASWEVWDGPGSECELGKVWAEKLEVFYEQSKWKLLDNFTKDAELDFTAMDEFIAEILATLEEHGSRAVRVFPPDANVLVSFASK
ncbi:hypothetical protein C8Q78DRAFT_1118265, partial [Trametes maxima]